MEHPGSAPQPSADAPLVVGPQPESAATGTPPHAPARAVLGPEQRALLDALLDRLIPPNGALPAAGALGVAVSIERTLADAAQLRRLFLDGLRAIDLAAGRLSAPPSGAAAPRGAPSTRDATPLEAPVPSARAAAPLVSADAPGTAVPPAFADLPADQQDALLRRVEAAQPAFFAALVNHAYRGYYVHPAVLRHLEDATGYPARPPQPLGHTLPPWDDALLARQRQRAPFWRRTS